MKAKLTNGFTNGGNHFGNDRLPHYTWMGKSETLSMVASVPDNKCIWFDKSGEYCHTLMAELVSGADLAGGRGWGEEVQENYPLPLLFFKNK